MKLPFRVVEIDRRPHDMEDLQEVRDQCSLLRDENRRLRQQMAKEFDRGFAAATLMVQTGATIERLREAITFPEHLPRIAKGTRDFEKEEDTEETRVIEVWDRDS